MYLLIVARLLLTLNTAYQVCADNPRTHHEFAEHKHVVAFAVANDAKDGDYVVFSVGDHDSDRLSASGSRIEFPAGLGTHEVAVKWFDHDGKLKREASTLLHVYPWSACQ